MNKAISDDVKAEIIRLFHEEGMERLEIAKKLGIGITFVRVTLKDNGFGERVYQKESRRIVVRNKKRLELSRVNVEGRQYTDVTDFFNGKYAGRDYGIVECK